MTDRKILHEVRLSKPLMAVATMATLGVLMIGLRPLVEATPAFAASEKPAKIAICSESGRACAQIFKNLAGDLRLGVTR